MLDTTLVSVGHGWAFLAVFIAATVGIRWRMQQGSRYVGIVILFLFAIAAWYIVPSALQRWGLIVASSIIAFIGTVDERIKLSARRQLLWQVIVALVLVLSGWSIPYVSNPFGEGIVSLTWSAFGPIMFPGSFIAFAWILAMINAVNWLDGADGLAGGVSLTGFLILMGVALLPSIYSETTFGLALAGLAALLAFLIWNFPPAKVYLGTVGSWGVGMFLALVAMQGGGKIATGLLIFALPLFDVIFVIVRRFTNGAPIWKGDTVSHVHHRLQAAGISDRHILVVAMVVTFWLGFVSMLVSTRAKVALALVAAAGVVIASLRLRNQDTMIKRYEENVSSR